MGSKLLDENKQPLSENQHFESFQTSPVSARTKTQQKDDPGFTSPMGKKELDRQTKEVCLQEPLSRMEEMKEKLIKEKKRILEGRELLIQQEKILKVITRASNRDAIESNLAQDMQIKINHLHKQLQHSELIQLNNSKELQITAEALGAESSQEREEVYNCSSSPTQKTAMVKQTQKSRNSMWLLVRYLLYSVCLYLTLLLVYKHVPDPIWVYQLNTSDSICHQPWTH